MNDFIVSVYPQSLFVVGVSVGIALTLFIKTLSKVIKWLDWLSKDDEKHAEKGEKQA